MIDENWAVSLERAQELFLSQPDVTQQNGNFYYKSCCISLKAQKPSAPPWNLPRIQLHITGEVADVQDIHRRFFLRFLSAGG